jgi:hypothetical protein
MTTGQVIAVVAYTALIGFPILATIWTFNSRGDKK